MKCPTCNSWVEVKESRPRQNSTTYRRYQCANLHKFSTKEQVILPKVK